MAKKSVEDRFCFTWGLPNLSDMGFVPLYAFMLRTYSELGLSRQEMLCIIHLASYHYNSPGGESRPSIKTVSEQMGYAHKQRVWEIIAKLEKDGRIIVTRRPGFTSIYDAHPFAQAAYDLWIKKEAEKQAGKGVTTESNTPTGSVTPHSNTPTGSVTPDSDGVLLPIVSEEYEEEKEIGREEDISLSPTEKEELSSLWSPFLDALAGTMTKQTFDTWLRGSRLIDATNGTWIVQLPKPHAVEWVGKRLYPGRSFQGVMKSHAPDVQEIKFVAKENLS